MNKTPPLLEKIADQGDDLETLKALRQKIAKTIDESSSGRDIASLSRQLQIVMTQIAEHEEERRVREADPVAAIIRSKQLRQVRDKQNRPIFGSDTEDDLETDEED